MKPRPYSDGSVVPPARRLLCVAYPPVNWRATFSSASGTGRCTNWEDFRGTAGLELAGYFQPCLRHRTLHELGGLLGAQPDLNWAGYFQQCLRHRTLHELGGLPGAQQDLNWAGYFKPCHRHRTLHELGGLLGAQQD